MIQDLIMLSLLGYFLLSYQDHARNLIVEILAILHLRRIDRVAYCITLFTSNFVWVALYASFIINLLIPLDQFFKSG